MHHRKLPKAEWRSKQGFPRKMLGGNQPPAIHAGFTSSQTPFHLSPHIPSSPATEARSRLGMESVLLTVGAARGKQWLGFSIRVLGFTQFRNTQEMVRGNSSFCGHMSLTNLHRRPPTCQPRSICSDSGPPDRGARTHLVNSLGQCLTQDSHRDILYFAPAKLKFKSQLFHLLAAGLWARYEWSHYPTFHICELGMMIAPTSQSCRGDWMSQSTSSA